MNKNSNKKHVNGKARIIRIYILLCIIWTSVMGAFCFFAIRNQIKLPMELARVEATASYNRDIVFRRWSSMHSGVYVPVTDTTLPNPYITNTSERDIHTPSGRQLTLMNPTYIARQVYELVEKELPIKGHLTSLTPLRQENAPAQWEIEALKSFERGEKEFIV
ncbi:MAG: DUF3365 domain-containing protein [Deltaproteobacteria bacterium]|nr:DUF3365 domain-containing protein [Deltaproteobacteria bacterium]